MRNLGQRNRRRWGSVASLGEYHSAAAEPDANANPESDPGGVAVSIRHTCRSRTIADFDFRFPPGDAEAFTISVTPPTLPSLALRVRLSQGEREFLLPVGEG